MMGTPQNQHESLTKVPKPHPNALAQGSRAVPNLILPDTFSNIKIDTFITSYLDHLHACLEIIHLLATYTRCLKQGIYSKYPRIMDVIIVKHLSIIVCLLCRRCCTVPMLEV